MAKIDFCAEVRHKSWGNERMVKELTEDDVKEILKHRDLLLEGLRLKRYDIYKLMTDEDSFVRSLALPSMNIGMTGSQGGGHDLSDFFIEYQKQVRKRNMEYHKILRQISEKEQTIHKVWTCFSNLSEPYYSYLHKIYVEGLPYKTVEQESGYSHQVFNQYRKKALDTIRMLFDYSRDRDDDNFGCEKKAASKSKSQHKLKHESTQYSQLTLDLSGGSETSKEIK